MPLGLMPKMSYEQKEIVLQQGDSALFYTDGLVEAHDPQREMLGFPRLQRLVAEHAEEGPLGDVLLEELYTFVGDGWEQEDDITLITLRRIPIPRTPVNKGKKKVRSVEAPILPPPARCPPFLERRSSTSRPTLQGGLSQRGVHLSLRGGYLPVNSPPLF